ncbi:MAG: PPC domain-containing DNA-binding protein [Actinomycetota bacterium]
MNARRFDDGTFVVVLQTGEEVMGSLAALADEHGVGGARVEGIGALREATLGFYDLGRKEYDRFRIEEEVEVLALLGNVSRFEGRPRIHLHATVSFRDGTARGGHVFDARVGATCELFLSPLPAVLERRQDDEVGLPLISL